tara:strand:+ start:70 stop:846 length:777 start_codon:yes stop_codon:yes gene_type:complete
MKKLILLIVCLSFVYTQCNETNWQEYAPNLIDCTFTDADLSNNDFSNMYFFNTMFIDSDFSNSSFLDSYFEKTYAINSDFSSSDFSNAQQGTQEAIFINCNLSGANFEGYYEYLYLLFSDINSANFENVYFLACEFIGSNFKNANFEYIEDSMFGWNNNIINNYFCDYTGNNISNSFDADFEYQENYEYGNIFENCPEWEPYFSNYGQECPYEDLNWDGFDDMSFDFGYDFGAISGDNNLDGLVNIVDIINLVNIILE